MTMVTKRSKNNSNRRRRYKEEPEYRDKSREYSRKSYEKKNGRVREFVSKEKKEIMDMGEYLLIDYGLECGNIRLVFDKQTLAEILGYENSSIVVRFIREGVIPEPVRKCRRQTPTAGYVVEECYTIDEILPMVELINKHRENHGAYIKKEDHKVLISKINQAVVEARNS